MPSNASAAQAPSTVTLRYPAPLNTNGNSSSTSCTGLDDATVAVWADEATNVPLNVWRSLTNAQQQHIRHKERDRNGIVRPKGYDVSFHYNAKVEAHHFGSQHPMKPWRLTLTKQLLMSYGLDYAMHMFESRPASKEELAAFHSRDYLDFLSRYVLHGH